jgi:hypothetical protein
MNFVNGIFLVDFCVVVALTSVEEALVVVASIVEIRSGSILVPCVSRVGTATSCSTNEVIQKYTPPATASITLPIISLPKIVIVNE